MTGDAECEECGSLVDAKPTGGEWAELRVNDPENPGHQERRVWCPGCRTQIA